MTPEDIRGYFWRKQGMKDAVRSSLNPYACDDQTLALAEIAAQLAELNQSLKARPKLDDSEETRG